MTHLRKSRLFTAITFCIITACCSPLAAGTISGIIESHVGQPTSGALVFITDAKSGLPLNGEGTTAPAMQNGQVYPLAVQSASDGSFTFNVPDGTYNLLAQKWEGTLLPMKDSGAFNSIPNYSDTVSLQGRTAGIAVPSAGSNNVRLAPAGTARVQLHFESGNNDSLAIISTAPPAMDPIFGFAGWLGDFMAHAIAMNRVPKGRTEFQNVPAGPVYVAVFANDNKPGFAAASVQAKDAETTTIKIELVADWSDGKKTPPKSLDSLYRKFEKNKWSGTDVPDLPKMQKMDMLRNPSRVHDLLVKENPIVTLPDGTSASACDIYAVLLYRELNR